MQRAFPIKIQMQDTFFASTSNTNYKIQKTSFFQKAIIKKMDGFYAMSIDWPVW
jgi:hypothetical protein